ncbi:MAG: Mg-protoporphyrin IX monomethyl ester oxidative cyclase [Saprospiraceae bacterium]|nr:MAG: Mg-protoporphyrin IX monomethyl ester oxidative cyclase [Saprospiraceae bacterium]
MKILLTHAYFLGEDKKEQQIMKPYPPLGLQYIAAYLEQHGFANEIFDTTFSTFNQLQKQLKQSPPDLIGIYTNLMTKLQVLKIIELIKNEPTLKHCRIVLGGPEVRHHKENFLKHGADIIAFGEGEITMLELVRHFSEQDNMDLDHIPGIAYLDKDRAVTTTSERAFITNVDELPMPAREKIDWQRYFDTWRKHHGYAMVTMSTMRGCPYACKWCSRAVYGRSYRRRSPEKVVDELEYLRTNYDFDQIWYVDDVFTVNHKWMRAFAQLVKERDLVIPYEAISRADRMNEEIVKLLKESGCMRIWIGAESGSQKVLDAMDRMTEVKKVTEMVQLSQAYGIEAGNFIMLGYPGETEADILETLDYLKKAKPDVFTLTTAYPIKGTPFYEEVESKFITDLDWSESTDRDIDFKRAYNRKYYHHAMNWIQREMAFQRLNGAGKFASAAPVKFRAMMSRLGMNLERIRG